jgi:hypothetical protein
MWRPRAASELVKLQSSAGAAVCSHSLFRTWPPSLYLMRSEILQIPRTSAAPKAVTVLVPMGPSTPSICKLGSNETSHRGEQVENRAGLADQRVGAHHSSRRFGFGTVVNAEEHDLRQRSDAANF